jgi:hypothetical protein
VHDHLFILPRPCLRSLPCLGGVDGGPLIVVPLSALVSWGGCGYMAGDITAPDDYDRACAVDDLAGVIPIDEDGAQALVLADESATNCYLPQHRALLRRRAADSEAGMRAAVDSVLADPVPVWEERGTWVSDSDAPGESAPGISTLRPCSGLARRSPCAAGPAC